MKRYFMALAYRGTAYHGWQIQDNAQTVQAVVQEALERLLGQPVPVVGSGRTDTGVHARQQIAHFDRPVPLDTATFRYRLNALLPPDISVDQLYEVPPNAHARHRARRRSYEYHLHNFKDPFAQDRSYYFRPKLRLDLIREATRQLVAYGEHDYRCFSKSRTQQTHFRCRITRAEWTISEELSAGQRMLFGITANRFLRGMVRAIVGTLLDVGTEKTTLEEFQRIIAHQDRQQAGRAVPAHGLYLTEVTYEF